MRGRGVNSMLIVLMGVLVLISMLFFKGGGGVINVLFAVILWHHR